MPEWKYEGPTARTCLQRCKLDPTTNAALWFEVFPPKHKQEAFGNFYQAALRTLEAPAAYSEAYTRRRELLRKTSLGVRDSITRIFVVKATGRFIVGLGAASVSETGIQLLRPWGVPYLPGSSLKGIASAAAHARGDDWASPEQAGGQPGAHHDKLFGSVDTAGCVIFHDTWWIPTGSKLPIELDVMTPHHMKYNGHMKDNAGEDIPPLDTDSPNPVSFLTCTGSYLVALTGPSDWLELAWKLLKEALENDGVGAKTAAGYGRFVLDHELEDPDVIRRREVSEKLERFVETPPDAGHRQQCARALVASRDDLGEQAVADFLKRIATGNERTWRMWLRDPKRVESFAWLADAAFGIEADAAPDGASAVERLVLVDAWFEKRVRPGLTGKKASKAKKKRHLILAFPDGSERVVDPNTLSGGDPAKLASHLSSATREAPKSVEVRLDGDGVVGVKPVDTP